MIVEKGPISEQERWENQEGYSPATIAAEIAGPGLRGGHRDPQRRRQARRDLPRQGRQLGRQRPALDGDHQRPVLSDAPYYLRVTKDRKPDAGHEVRDRRLRALRSSTSAASSTSASSSSSASASSAPTIRSILNTLKVVDDRLKAGAFWHRFSFDGYGERRDGKSWRLFADDTRRTLGRAWPIFAGERGEYELLAGRPAAAAVARRWPAPPTAAGCCPSRSGTAANRPGSPASSRARGRSAATPLAWTHAQLVRLAWSAEAGTPVERPKIVADRYTSGAQVGAILPCRPRAGAGFSFAARRIHEPTTLGARLSWPAETSGSQ